MALGTPSIQHNFVIGDRRQIIATVALDNSYPTGGYSVTGALFGLPGGRIDNVQFEQANGYRPQFDYTQGAQKIMMYTSAGTQTSNATDLSAITLRVTVTGK